MLLRLFRWLPALPTLEGPAWREYTLLAMLLCTVFLASLKPIDNSDSFWHLAVGREMWQTGHLVRTETFSHSVPGAPYYDEEWLFQALSYPAFKVLGYGGLSALVALLASLAVGLSYRCVRLLGGNVMILALWIAAFMPAFQTRVALRPDSLSMVFIMLLAEGLLRWRPEDPVPDRLWMMAAPLFWVWCQFHGGWSYGFALLGINALGHGLDAWRSGTFNRRLFRRLGAPLTASVLVIFVNPFGWHIPWFPVNHLLSFTDPSLPSIAEWQHTPWSWSTSLVIAILLLGFLMWLWPIRPLSFRDAFWCSSQSFLGLYWARYAGYAGLTLVPFASRTVMGLFRKPLLRRLGWTTALLAMFATALTYQSSRRVPEAMLSRYPVQETMYLLDHGLTGKVLHNYEVGGYLAWTAPHHLLTFFDGRYFTFIPASKDYWIANRSVKDFEDFLKKYDFDMAIRPYQSFKLRGAPGEPPRGPSALLFPQDRWALVYFGDYGMVFLRRIPAYEGVIARDEYKVLRPDDLEYLLWAARSGKIDRAALESDLLNALARMGQSDRTAPLREALAQLRSDHAKQR